jgi:meso-butanediol dehydrogenase/(S,S)-butanediol dehydrogenase/diacetyl reductase
MDLTGKVALITGGGSGIGSAVARRFVVDGAKVCVAGRRKDLLQKIAASLPPDSVKICQGDVSIHDDVKRMVETTVAFGGKLNILVNNAGMDQNPPSNVINLDPAIWHKVLEVNLSGPFYSMKECIPHMIKDGGGSIINVASLGGLRAVPNMPAYVSSKAGLVMLSQQVALDFGPQKVRCNVLCPGGVRTSMIEEAMSHFTRRLGVDLEGVFKIFTKDIPLRRIASADEIGSICSFLASDESSFMTGAVLPADGGAAIVDISGAAINRLEDMSATKPS